MKTFITTALFCSIIYSGIGAITNTISELNTQKKEINSAIALLDD